MDYKFEVAKGKLRNVAKKHYDLAKQIDKNKDGILQQSEIKDYLRKRDILKDPKIYSVDEKRILKNFDIYLEGKVLKGVKKYHSYAQVTKILQDLAKKYPDKVKLMSLGKTEEGRDIWAVKITKGAQKDTSNKVGVVITGLHHAREWMALESPLYLAQQLLEDYNKDQQVKKLVDNMEIWVVPLVNPDGYEYSRTKDPWWRKNRRPIYESDLPGHKNEKGTKKDKIVAYGVDLNRNYDDGVHHELYRPPGDTPESTWDDFSATSDNPRRDTYRGPSGASEKEVQAMLNLELKHKNIKGVIDYHSYGRMVLYPWGIYYKQPKNVKDYKELSAGMAKAIGDVNYRPMQSVNLYPASGVSQDIHQINDIYSITMEIGRSFQPPASEIDKMNQRTYRANKFFINWIYNKFKNTKEFA